MSISTATPTKQLSAKSFGNSLPRWKSPLAIRILIIALILAAWELSANNGWVDPLFASRPTDVVQALGNILPTSQLWADAGYTLTEVAIGYVIGITLGVLIGVILGSSRILREACQPILNALNSVPRIALVPLFVAWLGLGMGPRILMAVTVVVFVMVTTVLTAMSQPDRDSMLLARSLGASRREQLVKFELPRAVPVVISGLELALIYSFLGVIAAEIVSGSNGLGSRMTYYANLFQADNFFAVLVVLTAFTTLLTAAIRRIEKRLLHWHKFEDR
ncbi:ABC transporter permease [Arthrobacter sp. OV608]|uniref:ABC transporter permease n=1 Tax=Arthrobacter sp. OV608 TaxID=1882768 RepID=UPI0008B2E59F|nr:ABC transporter permease [Arthrobacter sp. OV608]SER28248.1 NitT/TauT family transport system permease protein [Arthrobacter sp. OV608]